VQDEALIVPVEALVRPTLVPFHLMKLPGTPVEALDLVESDIFRLANAHQANCAGAGDSALQSTRAAETPSTSDGARALDPTAPPAGEGVRGESFNSVQERYFLATPGEGGRLVILTHILRLWVSACLITI
jgi:hypothetical protein